MYEDYKDMGERTKKARKEKTKLSQEKMAEALGITREAYAQYETGRTPMQSRHMPTFCKITKIRADWLLMGEEPMDIKSPEWLQSQTDFLRTLSEEEINRFEEGLRFIFPDRFHKR